MTADQELRDFIAAALAHGTSREHVADALARAGWSRAQIAGGLAAFADIDFPIPVPRPKPYLSARDAFLYLLLFGTLYVSAYSLNELAFQFIDKAFPDPAANLYWIQSADESIRHAIARLVVAFPVFVYMTWFVGREIGRDPGKRTSKVRKWLTYLTLCGAAAVLIGDVVTLVYSFLNGEFASRVVLKFLSVAIIGGAIFVYYLWDLRQGEAAAEAGSSR